MTVDPATAGLVVLPGWARRPARELVRSARRALHRYRRPAAIRRYLGGADSRKLHLGAGDNRLEGWLNTDRDPSGGAVHLDAARAFPFRDNTFRYVFCEHLIEHLPYPSAMRMLRESHRVLAPGGRIRVATPDLRALMSLVDGRGGEAGRRYASWLRRSYFPDAHGPDAAFAVNQVMRAWGHRFVYDEDTLRAALEGAGFADGERRDLHDSTEPALRGLEGHGIDDGHEEFTRFETIIVEAVRR